MSRTYTADIQGNLSVIDSDITKTLNFEEDIAKLTLANDDVGKQLEIDERIQIEQNEELIFSGRVSDKQEDIEPAEIVVRGEILELKGEETNGRVFYNTDLESIITSLITEDINNTGINLVNVGDINADISATLEGGSDADLVFEQTGFTNVSENRYGDDTIFMGLPSKAGGKMVMRVENLSVPDDAFKSLRLNMYINNSGGALDTKIEYRDENGNNYVWNGLNNINGYEELDLRTENARTDGSITNNNVMEIRIDTRGELEEGRAIAVDSFGFETYEIVSRGLDLNIGDISISDNSNTIRKFNSSLYSALKKLNARIAENIIVDANTIKTVNKGNDTKFIEENEILWIGKDQIPKNIVNSAIIEGKDTQVQITSEDSISRYGRTVSERIRDNSIILDSDAEAVGKQLLDNKAFSDTEIEIISADQDRYNTISVGDEIEVTNAVYTGTLIVRELRLDRDNKTIIYTKNE